MTVTTTGELRVLSPRDLAGLHSLLDQDPVTHCFVASRVRGSALDPWRLGGEVWGWYEAGELASALYVGANLVPIETTPEARLAFIERLRRIGRRCSSIVGPQSEVRPLWALLSTSWGVAREVRADQPLLSIAGAPSVAPDPLVRRVHLDEVDVLLPACVAMFTEEVGVSPLAGGGAEAYRTRVADIVRTGRAFARIEDGKVVFKAEIGAVSEQACQVQGVWVDPDHRGRGLSIPAMATVVNEAYRIAPICSLYVNDFNTTARATYARVGFTQTNTFTTVLF